MTDKEKLINVFEDIGVTCAISENERFVDIKIGDNKVVYFEFYGDGGFDCVGVDNGFGEEFGENNS